MSKKAFDALAEGDRKILIEESRKMEGSVLKQVRADNTKALDSMKAQGLQVISASADFEKEMRKRGESVAIAEGKNYAGGFSDKVKSLIETYRSKNK